MKYSLGVTVSNQSGQGWDKVYLELEDGDIMQGMAELGIQNDGLGTKAAPPVSLADKFKLAAALAERLMTAKLMMQGHVTRESAVERMAQPTADMKALKVKYAE